VLAATAVAAVAAAGCGETQIDAESAEIDVREGIEGLGAEVTAVSCPEELEAARGEVLRCRAETSKGAFRVSYRLLDDDGTVGRPRIERLGRGASGPG
jgi:hypothetical protein